MLQSIADVQDRIGTGRPLLLAGSEDALSQLPQGNWIGGTIPYFMDAQGGVCTESRVFVTELPDSATTFAIRKYSEQTVASICTDAPQNGFSVVIIPAGSMVHRAYAEDAPNFDGFFLKPIVGWISGVHLSKLGQQHPMVFDGRNLAHSREVAIAMHVTLPANKLAEVEIVNPFRPGSGDVIMFPQPGFQARECQVNGQTVNFAQYASSAQRDARLPLTADYNGSVVNVSLQSIDSASGTVTFYAPVFPGVEYRFASPVSDYMAEFEAALRNGGEGEAAFACNCVLNYVHASLEGKPTGGMTGPITFGEIANLLLNQTLVRLLIRDIC